MGKKIITKIKDWYLKNEDEIKEIGRNSATSIIVNFVVLGLLTLIAICLGADKSDLI